MGWSWYLANDMQFFVISPIIFLPLFFLGKKGLLVPGLMLLGNAICTGVISKENDMGPNTVTGGKEYFRQYYTKPYTRIGPYLVGMVTGWILYKTECKARLHWVFVICGWVSAAVIALSVLYGLYDHTDGTPLTTDVSALYNALHRSAWGVAVCWVIFACASGYGGPINRFLSWPWLLPLSRLTYCAYLVHPLVIQYFFRTQRQLFYCNNSNLIFAFLAILWMTFFLAFAASMAFESPFLGLEKMVLAAVGRVSSVLSPPIKRLFARRKDGLGEGTEYTVRFSNKPGDRLP